MGEGAPTTDRVGYAIVAVGAVAAVVLARIVTPSPTGVGTHQQLGLPPCTFHLLTGHGCPGCGLTTSFAHVVRGDIATAFATNPMGPVLFVLVALTAPAAGYLAFRPVPMDGIARSGYFVGTMIAILVGMIVGWTIRLVLGQV